MITNYLEIFEKFNFIHMVAEDKKGPMIDEVFEKVLPAMMEKLHRQVQVHHGPKCRPAILLTSLYTVYGII